MTNTGPAWLPWLSRLLILIGALIFLLLAFHVKLGSEDFSASYLAAFLVAMGLAGV